MSRIIQGKGLQSIVDITGKAPVPTPAAVFDFITLLEKESIFQGDFALLDMGGATTDYYSAAYEQKGEKVIRKGIREPFIKRSVEGDLGMRVSANSAIESNLTALKEEISNKEMEWDSFRDYITKISRETEYIPSESNEKTFDSILAGFCTVEATVRHGGTRRDIYTTSGSTILETGRNLKNIKTIIGTGGYLASLQENPFDNFPVPVINNCGEEILSPVEYKYFTDDQYLIPLLANAARIYPEEAAASLKPNIKGLYGGNSKQKN
jgi:uncharacterized protein (TIGR01319 family)